MFTVDVKQQYNNNNSRPRILMLFCLVFLLADKLQEHWDHAVTSVHQRRTQLDDMLIECRQFEELHAEFDRWLVTVEQELATDPAQKLNTQRLNKQNKVSLASLHTVPLAKHL